LLPIFRWDRLDLRFPWIRLIRWDRLDLRFPWIRLIRWDRIDLQRHWHRLNLSVLIDRLNRLNRWIRWDLMYPEILLLPIFRSVRMNL
jgi:hypothetical protein